MAGTEVQLSVTVEGRAMEAASSPNVLMEVRPAGASAQEEAGLGRRRTVPSPIYLPESEASMPSSGPEFATGAGTSTGSQTVCAHCGRSPATYSVYAGGQGRSEYAEKAMQSLCETCCEKWTVGSPEGIEVGVVEFSLAEESAGTWPSTGSPVVLGHRQAGDEGSGLVGPNASGIASPTSMASPISTAAKTPRSSVANNAREVVSHIQSRILEFSESDMTFSMFTSYVTLLFIFTLTANVFIIVIETRSRLRGIGLPDGMVVLQYLWICFEILLGIDLAFAYLSYFLCPSACADRPRFLKSSFHQPFFVSIFTRCLGFNLEPRGFVMLLAVLMPVNALLMYVGIGEPVFTPTIFTGDFVATYDAAALLSSWQLSGVARGGGMVLNTDTWVVTAEGEPDRTLFTVTSNKCYHYSSAEYSLLGKLRHEERPKQAYCESLAGTMLMYWRIDKGSNSLEWQRDEDVMEEAFQFIIRLFGSLAGLVVDSQQKSVGSWFVRDMTDVFDMYMLTFADVAQMAEGRPLLAGDDLNDLNHSMHAWIAAFLLLGYLTVSFRALNLIGWRPIVRTAKNLGSTADEEDLGELVDACLALVFIEIPFLTLRFVCWKYYGVPVSVMGVKNVFGVVEELHSLGVFSRFQDRDGNSKGLALCWKRRHSSIDCE